jgi:tetratricopeptide (TPR) repeat protein
LDIQKKQPYFLTMTRKHTTIIRPLTRSILRAACLAILFSWLHIGFTLAQESSIPEAEITSLQQGTAAQTTETSATKKRRACKSTIRSSNALIEANPTAPNRFRVLAIMLQSHRRLLALDNSDKNREALFETCGKLLEAPDSYANLRLEADLIISEKRLSEKKADVKQRAQALTDMVQRYRNTPAEIKSLKIAILIAPKLDAFDLEQQLIKTLSEHFQGNHNVIEYRRKIAKSGLLDVLFSGNYKRADGTFLKFPIDCMSHTTLLYFWSKQTPDLVDRFDEVKAIQTKFPDRFRVFSFNLDALPDAGEKFLREKGLNWTAIHFPDGKMNPAYRTYVKNDPGAVLINAQGHSQLVNVLQFDGFLSLIPRTDAKQPKTSAMSSVPPTLELCLDSFRYLSQLQALFIGDFLVAEKPKPALSIPTATMDAIQACFTAAPHRYRLSQKEALDNYTKAEKLCRTAIKTHPDAADLWRVSNRRIIALLGMWNLGTEPKHLETAVKEAQASLATPLPPGANVVPQFCLAKNGLRLGKIPPAAVLEVFIKATGGDKAPATAIAAAALLAMDANDRDFHAKYREALLKLDNDNPALWPVFSFLRDRHHTYRAFRATYSRFGFSRAERHANRRNIAALDEPADTSRVIKTDLTTLDGKTISLPQATDGKMTFVAFIELPTGEVGEKNHNTIIKQMTAKADAHEVKGIKVIAAFLSDDTDKIKAFVKRNEWTCQVAMLPEGLDNPLVAKYGILSADLMPNVFLLRPDGSISWSASGLIYPVQGSTSSSLLTSGINSQIDVLQMETAKSALDQGNFKKAVKLFSEVLAPKKLKGDWWATFRYYSRSRAYIGLKNWEAALADIDVAIDAHQTFAFGKVHRCELHKEMELYKADILKQLGRDSEAKALRIKAATPTTPHNKSPFGIYTEGRENFRLNPHSGK